MTAMSFSLEIYGNSSISGDDRCDQKFFKFSAHVTIGSVNSPLLPHIFGVAIDFLDRYYAFRSREISIAHGESSPVEESFLFHLPRLWIPNKTLGSNLESIPKCNCFHSYRPWREMIPLVS